MKSFKRRAVLRAAGAIAVGRAAAYADPGTAVAQERMPFVVPPTFVPTAGSDQFFPVRRIYCIDRNYAAHSREMGSDPTREPPVRVQKPTDAIQIVPLGAKP